LRVLNFSHAATISGPHDNARKSVESKIDDSADGAVYRVSYADFRLHEHFNLRNAHSFFRLHFKSKTLLIFFFFPSRLQPAIATDMRGDVDSIWSCTSSLVVFRVEFVWIVDMIQPDDTVIIARRASIGTRRNQSPTKRRADVSRGLSTVWETSCRFSITQKSAVDRSLAQERLLTSTSQFQQRND
jgi:hypothetical protein